MKNILFIRDPKQIISSYAQVRPDVNMQDIGIAKQWELYNQLTENNLHCVVLDSNEILKSPEKVLRDLCSAIDIRFDKAMLHWPAGPKKKKMVAGQNTGTTTCINPQALKGSQPAAVHYRNISNHFTTKAKNTTNSYLNNL